MRARIPNRSVLRHALWVVLIVAAIGCDNNPTAPSTVPPPTQPSTQHNASASTPAPTPAPAVASAAIVGTTTFTRLGDTSQLRFIATLPDGSTRDDTGIVSWWSHDLSVATITPSGLVTAVGYGRGGIGACYRKLGAVSPPPAQVRVVPDGSFMIVGRVTESGGFRLPGARVSGTSPSGTVTATSSYDGSYTLAPLSGQVTVRAEKDGFVVQERRLEVRQDETVNLDLARGSSPGKLDGIYTLTFTADPACTLGQQFSRRTYQVRLTETPDGVLAELDGPGFPNVWGWDDGFTGKRDGANVEFVIVDENANYVIREDLGGQGELCFKGVAAGTITDRVISTVFNGIVYHYGPWPRPTCSGNHQLVFTR